MVRKIMYSVVTVYGILCATPWIVVTTLNMRGGGFNPRGCLAGSMHMHAHAHACTCTCSHCQCPAQVPSINNIIREWSLFMMCTPRRSHRPGKLQVLLLSLSSLTFMLPWQFAQFVLLTQQLSLAIVYSLGLVGPAHFLSVTVSIALALLANVILQFGNSLLLTSFLPPCLLMSLVSSEGRIKVVVINFKKN